MIYNKERETVTVKNLVCIICPQGCRLEALMDGDRVAGVKGNNCKRGETYAASEAVNPVRTLTSTVKLSGGKLPVAPVKSDKPVPKELLLECMKLVNGCSLKVPVRIGDVVLEDIMGTGANIVVTSNIF